MRKLMRKYVVCLVVMMLIVQIVNPGANRAQASGDTPYVLVNEAGNGTEATPEGADPTKAKEIGLFGSVTDMAVDASGNLYFTLSSYNLRVYKVTPAGDFSVFAGYGAYMSNPHVTENETPAIGKKANEVRFSGPRSIVIDSQDYMYIAENNTALNDEINKGKIYKVNISTQDIVDIYETNRPDGLNVVNMALDQSGNLYIYYSRGTNAESMTWYLGKLNVDETNASHRTFTTVFSEEQLPIADNRYQSIAVDSEGDLYFTRAGRESAVMKYSFSTGGQWTPFVETSTSFTIMHPRSVAFDASGNAYITTSGDRHYRGKFGNQVIKVDRNGTKSRIAGRADMDFGNSPEGTVAVESFISSPFEIAVHPVNGTVYFEDHMNKLIRSIRPAYNIQYVGNEATGGEVPSIEQVYGGRPAKLALQGTLVKEGHVFQGWNTAADGLGTPYPSESTITPTADLTLYAIWEIERFNLIYKAGANGTLTSGGLTKQTEIRNENVPYNTTMVDPVIAEPNSGYGFGGWDDGEENASRKDTAIVSFDVTANFLKEYTVTFATYGGTEIAPQIVLDGRLLTLSTLPTNGDLALDGWYTDAEWTAPFDIATTPITSDLTLFASWVKKHTVSLYPHNGQSENNISVTEATYMPLIPDPVRTGYTFQGWYTDDGTFTQAFDFAATAITGNISLYAKWALLPPEAPAIASTTPGNANVELVWNGVPFATEYNVYQGTNSGMTGTLIATVTDSIYQYEATGLTNGTTYYFVVAAVNESGENPSLEVNATPRTVADAPTGVTAVAFNGQATITFTAPSDNGGSAITGYRVTSTPDSIVVTTTNNDTTVEVMGLTNGTPYTFTVEALNAAGYGVASEASGPIVPKAVAGAPTGVTAVAGNGQATITFTAPSDNGGNAITGYRVTSTPGNIVKTTTNDDTTIVVTGLTNGTSYTFKVEALNAVGYGLASAASEAVTPKTVAGAPTGVTAVAGNGQATITFTAPSDNGESAITGYRVTSSPGNIVKTTTNDATTIVVTGLTNGTTYTFTVEALNEVGYGAASAASGSVTPKTVPGAPTGVTAVAGNGQATITFTPSDNGGSAITGYRVTSTPGNIVKTTTNDDTTIVVTGLTNGTSYTFKVEALNEVSYGAASAASGAVTPKTVAGAPTGVTAIAGNGQATITFTAPSDNGESAITGYRVTSSPGNMVKTTTNDATTIVVTGLTNGTTYTFTVEALNEVGYGAASEASGAVTPMTVAGAPTGVTAVAGNGHATITFTAPSDNGGSAITGYRVTSTPGNIVKTTTNDDTTIVVTGLTNGTSYTFKVEALNEVGYGAASAASGAVTPKTVAGAPTGVTAIAGNGQATITFTAPSDNGESAITGYRVTSTPGNIVKTTENDNTSIVVTGLTNGTSYTFTVEALNEVGYGAASAASGAVTPKTVAGAPTGVTAVAGNGHATITFTAPSDNGGSAITGYRVTSTPGNIVKTTENDDTTIVVTGLTNGTSYTFKVEALNAVGYGAASAASGAVTPIAVAGAPTGVTAVAGNGQATISFTAPTDNGESAIVGYRVTSTPGNIVKTTENDDTTIVVTGLTNGTSYTFKVEALNAVGYGAASAASGAVTPMTVAGAPTGVTGVAGNEQATITFTAPSDNGGSAITGYRVTSTLDNIVVTTTNDDTTIEITGLTNGTSYTFTVEALNAMGYGAASAASGAVTPKTVAGAPTGVTAVAGNGQATITFTAPSDNGGSAITGYRVTSSPDNIVRTTTNDSTTVAVTGLTNGTPYTFTVEALNAAGNGAASAATEAVTPTAPPSGGSGGSGGSGDGGSGGSGGGGGGSANSGVNPDSIVSTNGEITLPAGVAGEAKLGDTITIAIPAGASEQELRLTIEQISNIEGLASQGEVLASPVYELLKNFSDNFAKPVVLTFKFDVTTVQEGQRAAIFYYDEDGKTWIEIGGIVSGDTLTAEVDHFTKFAVLVVDEQAPAPNVDIAGHWAENKIAEAVELGIVSGYEDGTFKPNALITRAEFSVMLAKALKLDGPGAPLGFIDEEKIGAWAKAAVGQAAEAGIINGYSDNSFRPGANITRTELAVMIARAYSTEAASAGSSGFADESEIPGWAKNAVSLVKELGIVSGKKDNKFAPQDTASRAEAVTMIINLLQVKK